MQVIADTREQDTAYFRARTAQMGCAVIREKLDFGDYSARFLLDDGAWFDMRQHVAIERKSSLDELALCFARDRARFEREFIRAGGCGARLYLLVEGATWEAAISGEYRSKMAPQALVSSLIAWMCRYDCRVIMCRAKTSGRLIRDILHHEGRQRLLTIQTKEEQCLTEY